MFTSSDHMLQCPPRQFVMDRKWKSNVESAPNCPRCASSNTKFCYYNNYSLSQPRYFCKGCRRYWTKGGSLRNVPVGGGCRRNRRGKSIKVQPTRTTTTEWPVPVTSSSPPNEPFVTSNGEDSTTVQSDIDLAVVFAKFFNQNSSSDQTEFVGPEVPNVANNNNVQQEEIMIEYQKPFMGEAELLRGLPDHEEVFVGEKKQESEVIFMGNNDSNALGSFQSLLGDDHQVRQEALWSDDASSSSNLQNFPWQPMLQFQEFESINLQSHDDEQFRISTFPISDNNWSSFDMSGLEVFLRP